MAGDPPYIFVKHIYATAAIAGALLFCALRLCVPQHIAMLSGAILIVAIRLLASHYRWSLPKPGQRGWFRCILRQYSRIAKFFVFFHKKIKKTYWHIIILVLLCPQKQKRLEGRRTASWKISQTSKSKQSALWWWWLCACAACACFAWQFFRMRFPS